MDVKHTALDFNYIISKITKFKYFKFELVACVDMLTACHWSIMLNMLYPEPTPVRQYYSIEQVWKIGQISILCANLQIRIKKVSRTCA